MSDKGKRNKKKRKKEETAEDIIKEKGIKRQKHEEYSENTQEKKKKKGKKRKNEKQKTDKKDKGKRHKYKRHKRTLEVILEEDEEVDDNEENFEKNKDYDAKRGVTRPSVFAIESSGGVGVDKTNEKNNTSNKSKKVNDNKAQKKDKTKFLPQIIAKENSEEIYEMFRVYNWDNDSEMKESLDVNSGSDYLTEKQAEYAVGGENFYVFDETNLVSIEKINFHETNDVCCSFNSVSETSKPFNSISSYFAVDPCPTMDLSELDEKSDSDMPCNFMETTDENFFKNIVAKFFSLTGECSSSFEKTTYVETNSLSLSLSLEEDSDLSNKDSKRISDSEGEDSDEETEGSDGDLECSVLEMVPNEKNLEEEESETETEKFDTCKEKESDEITKEHKKDEEYKGEQSKNDIKEGAGEKFIEGAGGDMREEESSKPNECFREEEFISTRECRREKVGKKEDESQREHKQVKMEVVKFKQLCKILDGYIPLVEIPENFDDEELFISTIKQLLEEKSIYDQKNSAGSSSEEENSSYPELIIAVQKIFNVSMKKIYESDFPLCTNDIQEGMINGADNMNIFLKCFDDYFVFFLKSIMTDSLACDDLFEAFIKHLKSSLSSFNKIHPFLLLIIFSNYPKSNCIMLCKFLNVCKVIFSVNFNYSYALPYLQNLKRFLLFSMLEVYHHDDVNQIHYLFRKEAARFYYYIIAKYYSEEQKIVISYLKRILQSKESKFCTCYGALCAIRAMGSEIEAEAIPEIFPLIVMKLKSVKRFAKEELKIFSVKTCDFDLAQLNQSEFDSESQSLFPSVNQTDVIAVSSPESKDEIQSESFSEIQFETTEMHELFHCLSQSQGATLNKSEKFSENRFDTLIPSEYIYASLIREELLNSCSQLLNKYVKNNLASEKKSYLLSFTNNNSVSSATVETFLDYFGQELRELIPLKYASKSFSQNTDIFIEKLMIDLKLRKHRLLLY